MSNSVYAHDSRFTGISIHLLGGFSIAADGYQLRLPFSAQRVLAALALRPTLFDRTQLGEILYPQGRKTQISASLRSALWRAKREVGGPLIESHGPSLGLAQDVTVDLQYWMHKARILTSTPDIECPVSDGGEVEALSQELLPTWGEEWLVLDQQRWDQLRLHALERLAERFLEDGRHMEALEAGLAAVSIEPYRESAHRALIRTFIAEGNSEAQSLNISDIAACLLMSPGLRPSSQMKALVDGLTRE